MEMWNSTLKHFSKEPCLFIPRRPLSHNSLGPDLHRVRKLFFLPEPQIESSLERFFTRKVCEEVMQRWRKAFWYKVHLHLTLNHPVMINPWWSWPRQKKEIPIQNASAQFFWYTFMLFLKTSNRLLSHSVFFFSSSGCRVRCHRCALVPI